MRTWLIALALAALLIMPAWPAAAQTAGCQFILGFATLHSLDPQDTGECLDNQAFAANGDALQHTTKGLMVWRKADNYTAFTNGYMTWVNGPYGLQSRLNTERFPWEAAAPPASSAPAPSGAAPAPAKVTVNVGGGTFSPASVTIPAGGTVVWQAQDDNVHSAQSLAGAPAQFNTGPIPGYGSMSMIFVQPGTYSYLSGVDCVQPPSGPLTSFNCGGAYQIVVTGSASSVVPSGATTVTINDSTGFSPANLVIRSGQIVRWVNGGTTVHSVVSNPGFVPSFNSGGIAPGQSFSQIFNGPLLAGYHSDTDVTYSDDNGLLPIFPLPRFLGEVSVLPPA